MDERSSVNPNTRPIQYAVYKGKTGKAGAIQFNLMPFSASRATESMDRKESEKARKGAVFIDAARASEPDKYDWENGIKFSMGPDDLGSFLAGTASMGEEGTELVNLFHQHNNAIKKLIVKQGRMDKNNNPTFMLTISEQNKEAVVVPISVNEMFTIRSLFTAAIPRILGW